MFSERNQKWKSTYYMFSLPLSIKIGKSEFVLWQVSLVCILVGRGEDYDQRRAWGALGYWQCSVLGLDVWLARKFSGLQANNMCTLCYVNYTSIKKIRTTNLKIKKLASVEPLLHRCVNWGLERLNDECIVTWLSRSRTENDQGVGAASAVHFRLHLRVTVGYFPRRFRGFQFVCVVFQGQGGSE